MGRFVLEDVTKVFSGSARGGPVTAVDRFSLDVPEGKLLVLLGPSGCGKTTLLRLIAGLDEPSAGRISLDGQSLEGVAPQKRSIGMAFQYPALLPQLSVRENIALGPKLRGVAIEESKSRIAELARLLALTDLLDRAPETLSGGQQQRVSLARALANRPAVLLLDEPLANLDPLSRAELRDVIRSAQQQLGLTTVYVTHDQNEAAAIADRIVVMNRGAVQQSGTSAEIYTDPANLFVAEFFDPDRPNLFPATLRGGRLKPEGSECEFPVAIPGERPVICVIRQRAISNGDQFRGTIHGVQHTGWSTKLLLDLGGLPLRAEIPFAPELTEGDSFSFALDHRDLLLFESASRRRIRS
jgi:ABC-type sugar transport system ATPase subunit